MNLARMLEKCQRDQWSIDDLDWSGSPRAMSPDDEVAVVQYFTDMAQIELLAGALFREQERRVDDPTLKAIFRSFVLDEARHSKVAMRLARYYDVHRYRTYRPTPHLESFFPRFIETIRWMPPDIANVYITTGELILDIALLRSINDYVNDGMSQRAMDLINRDESRHIAVDYHMAEYYSGEAYARTLKDAPRRSPRDRAAAALSLARVLFHAGPFVRDVFFRPMEVVDPSGKRMREAWKRAQMLGVKQQSVGRPFVKTMLKLQDLYRRPLGRALLGPVLERIIGVPGSVLVRLIEDKDEARARHMSFGELAEEALAAKYDA